jgi:hypothetical protein
MMPICALGHGGGTEAVHLRFVYVLNLLRVYLKSGPPVLDTERANSQRMIIGNWLKTN